MDDMAEFSNLLGGLDGSVWSDGVGEDAGDGVFGLEGIGDGVDAFMATMGAGPDMLGLGSSMGDEDVLADVPSDLEVESMASSRSDGLDAKPDARDRLRQDVGSDGTSSARQTEIDKAAGKGGVSADGASSSGGGAAKRKRQNLTPDERLKQNRDRNREHARNTRLRKKAFVEDLKKTVQDLVAKREREVRQRRMHAARSREQHEVQLKVLSTFLNYRGTFMADRRKWAAILSSTFKMVLPLTRYRPFDEAQVQNNRRELVTLDALLEDVSSLKRFATSILRGKAPVKAERTAGMTFAFHVDANDVIYKGGSLMALWSAVSDGYAAYGAREFCCRGMAHVVFDKANKIGNIELIWDSLGVSRSFGRVARALHLAGEGEFKTAIAPIAPKAVVTPAATTPSSPTADSPMTASLAGDDTATSSFPLDDAIASERTDVCHSMEIDLLRQLLEDVCADRIGSTVVKRPSSDGMGIQRTYVRLVPFTPPSAAAGGSESGAGVPPQEHDVTAERNRKGAAEGTTPDTVHFMGVLEDLPTLARMPLGQEELDESSMMDAVGQKSNSMRRSKRHRALTASGGSNLDHYDELADDESGDDMMKTDDASRRKHLRRNLADFEESSLQDWSGEESASKTPDRVADDSDASRRLTRSTARKL